MASTKEEQRYGECPECGGVVRLLRDDYGGPVRYWFTRHTPPMSVIYCAGSVALLPEGAPFQNPEPPHDFRPPAGQRYCPDCEQAVEVRHWDRHENRIQFDVHAHSSLYGEFSKSEAALCTFSGRVVKDQWQAS